MFPKIQEIIDVLKKVDNSPKSKLGFDMNWDFHSRRNTHHPCGSACCIGGHAIKRLEYLGKDIKDYTGANGNHLGKALAELCEIPEDIADKLCWPPSCYVSYEKITLEDAIKVLEKCKNEGVVDWSIASVHKNLDT